MNRIKTKTYIPVASILAILALLVAVGCGGEEDPGYPPVKYDKGQKFDKGLLWPDKGQVKNDLWVPPKPDMAQGKKDGGGQKDNGGPGKDITVVGDGSTSPDSGGTCPLPSGAKCSPACSSGQICTPAKGGLCAKVTKLTGPASAAKAFAPLAEALGACWKQSPVPKSDKLCGTLDLCTMTGNLTESMLYNWVCSTAKASDFSSAQAFTNAKDVVGCGLTNLDDLDWKLAGAFGGGARGKICFTYNVVSVLRDDVELNLCSAFPPK